MKIAIVGNSHLAALKLGWAELARAYPSVELVFFGARSTAMKHLTVQGRRLVSTDDDTRQDLRFTSNGLEAIVPDDFDALLVYGLALDVHVFSQVLTRHALYDRADDVRRTVSLSCFTEICENRARRCLLHKIATQIRSISAVPLFVSPSPFPSRNCAVVDQTKWQVLVDNHSPLLHQGYYDGIRRLCGPLSAVFAPQPGDTVVDSIFTDAQFSQGSVRLTEGLALRHSADDVIHMNQAYGRLFLTEALALIAGDAATDRSNPLWRMFSTRSKK